jgi:streptolysin S family bacteriocin protoxin
VLDRRDLVGRDRTEAASAPGSSASCSSCSCFYIALTNDIGD